MYADDTQLYVEFPRDQQVPATAATNRIALCTADVKTWMASHNCCILPYLFRSIAKIRKCLTTAACKTIVHALVMSRVDYGNALLFGLPEMQLHKLQMIQNSAARLVTGTHGRDHITPVLFKLHWLPVRYRIEFKLLVLVYQAVHHLGPAYLTSLVTPYAPTRALRSAAHRSRDTTSSAMVHGPFLRRVHHCGTIYRSP